MITLNLSLKLTLLLACIPAVYAMWCTYRLLTTQYLTAVQWRNYTIAATIGVLLVLIPGGPTVSIFW